MILFRKLWFSYCLIQCQCFVCLPEKWPWLSEHCDLCAHARALLRPRPRPFKFGWVSISLSYAKISVFCPASSARLLSSNVILCDQYLLYVFMYSWVYDGAPQPCFSRCMVDCTLMTDQMTTLGSCNRRLNLLPIFKQARTSRGFNENQPKHQNRNFLKTFCNYLWWNLFTTFI